jgi:hypothetical protein
VGVTRRRLSLFLLVVGLVVGIVGGVGAATHDHDLYATTGATIQTGDDFTVQMHPGHWAVYQETGTEQSVNLGFLHFASSSDGQAPRFQIEAIGPGGAPLVLTPEPTNETQTVRRGDDLFTAQAEMTVVTPGRYQFRVATAGGAATKLLVAPTVGAIIHSVLGWSLTLFVGIGLAVAGLVLFLIDRTARQQGNRVAAGRWAAPPPPP